MRTHITLDKTQRIVLFSLVTLFLGFLVLFFISLLYNKASHCETMTDTRADCIVLSENEEQSDISPAPSQSFAQLCGLNLNWQIDGTDLIVSGNGNMYDYSTKFPAPWSTDAIERIIISEGVLSIGEYAFYQTLAKEIVLPNSLRVINAHAFEAGAVSQISLGPNVNQIGDFAFYDNSVKAFTVSEDNTSFAAIGGILYSFDGAICIAYPCATSREELILPDTVQYIAKGAFAFSDINHINLNHSISVEEGAFAFSKLEKIALNNVQDIGDKAFYGTQISEVSIPGSVIHIGEYAFVSTGLKKVYLYGMPKLDISEDGSPFSKSQHSNEDGIFCEMPEICVPEDITIEYVIDGENDVWDILDNEIQRQFATKFVIQNVESIPENAFKDCIHLEEVVITNVSEISDNAFSGCINLKEIHFSDNLERIGEFAFKGTAVTELAFPSSLLQIGDGAFDDCAKLEKVFFPSEMISIGTGFWHCPQLQYVELPEKMEILSNEVFAYDTDITELVIPAGIQVLEDGVAHDSSVKRLIFEGQPEAVIRFLADEYPCLQQLVFLSGPPLQKTEILENYANDETRDGIVGNSLVTLYFLNENIEQWAPNGETEWNGFPIVGINSVDNLPDVL